MISVAQFPLSCSERSLDTLRAASFVVIPRASCDGMRIAETASPTYSPASQGCACARWTAGSTRSLNFFRTRPLRRDIRLLNLSAWRSMVLQIKDSESLRSVRIGSAQARDDLVS